MFENSFLYLRSCECVDVLHEHYNFLCNNRKKWTGRNGRKNRVYVEKMKPHLYSLTVNILMHTLSGYFRLVLSISTFLNQIVGYFILTTGEVSAMMFKVKWEEIPILFFTSTLHVTVPSINHLLRYITWRFRNGISSFFKGVVWWWMRKLLLLCFQICIKLSFIQSRRILLIVAACEKMRIANLQRENIKVK